MKLKTCPECDNYKFFINAETGELTCDDCEAVFQFKTNYLENEIHANAREARARQCLKAVVKKERPDIAAALILQAIDDWDENGLTHGRRLV